RGPVMWPRSARAAVPSVRLTGFGPTALPVMTAVPRPAMISARLGPARARPAECERRRGLLSRLPLPLTMVETRARGRGLRCRTSSEKTAPAWLPPEWLWAQFARPPQRAVGAYRRFVAAGAGETPWHDLTGQMYYGDDAFVAKVTQGTKQSSEVPRRQPLRPALAALARTGIPAEVGQAYRDYGYRLGASAQQLGVHYATVSRRLRAFELGQ